MRIERYLTPPGEAPTGFFAHPVLALGFRPFFLLASIMAVVWVPLWLLLYHGVFALPERWIPMSWHAHEMVFGFATAIVAGFLLTAVRNWTKQKLPSGRPLAALVVLWLLGRVAMLMGGLLPATLVTVLDVAFLPATAIAIAIPIARAKNRRNAAFPFILLVLGGLNLTFHLAEPGVAHQMAVVGVDLLVLLLVFMGGRVIPFFTKNAISEAHVRTYSWLNWASVLATAALIPLHLTEAEGVTAVVALLAGALNILRLWGWDPVATLGRPIVWILHLGYFWVGLGLLMAGIGHWVNGVGGPATHALTVGALGTLILGMLTRVSLGHTGRPLVVSRAIVWSYWLITAAAILRVFGPMLVSVSAYPRVLDISSVCWSLAFLLFVVVYTPILTSPRPDGAPG